MSLRPIFVKGWLIATIVWVILCGFLIVEVPDYAKVIFIFMLVTTLLWWGGLFIAFYIGGRFRGDKENE